MTRRVFSQWAAAFVLALGGLLMSPRSEADGKCGDFFHSEALVVEAVEGDISGLGLDDPNPRLTVGGFAEGPIYIDLFTDGDFAVKGLDEVPPEDVQEQD